MVNREEILFICESLIPLLSSHSCHLCSSCFIFSLLHLIYNLTLQVRHYFNLYFILFFKQKIKGQSLVTLPKSLSQGQNIYWQQIKMIVNFNYYTILSPLKRDNIDFIIIRVTHGVFCKNSKHLEKYKEKITCNPIPLKL